MWTVSVRHGVSYRFPQAGIFRSDDLATHFFLVCRRKQSDSVETMGNHGYGQHWFTSFSSFGCALQVPEEGISRDGGFKILVVSGSFLLALGVMEGVLRLFSGWLPVEVQQIISANPRNYGVAHPYIGHLQTPNNALVLSGKDYRAVHHTDGYGFRNKWPWPKSAQIVALGDSVTFGQGVEDEEAWPAIVARSFPESQLINLGLIGGGPQQYLRIYETFGQQLHPRVVLVGLFMGNDFWDAEMFDRWVKSGAGGSYMVWRDFGRPYSVSLSLQQPVKNLESAVLWRAQLIARKSHLFNLVLYSLGDFTKWSPAGGKTFHTPGGTQLELAPGVLANNTKKAHPGDEVFRIVLETLQRIQKLAHQNGATAVVVLQRSKEEVYLPLLGEPLPDAAAPLRAEFEKRDIAYLDLLPEFRRRAAAGEVLFFETDGHPNSRGYALIGEIVTSYLKEHAKEYGL